MIRNRVVPAVVAVVALAGLTLAGAQVAVAQDAAPTVSAPTSASTPKQIRKAQRKAARAKKNAELSALEKNGYHMTGGKQTDYPENLENAERKAHAAQAGSGALPAGK